jgi:ATP-binding cassette subfamily B protein
VGIFGPIGSGKSTLFNLLTRITKPAPGEIFFKGQDILTLDPPALRRKIGYAQQSVHLFSDSIKANLRLGMPDATDAELQQAACAAQIEQEIEEFDNGWDTEIGEKGLRLSGGQKQRLALARVFLRGPELYLLDDVLSAVDQETERRLIKTIHATASAMLIATHRLSVLKKCDRILMLDKGQIIDSGTFAELIVRHPFLSKAEEDAH